ncbi:MAG: GGDEF domain-containing protein, partial [Gammaproteobacteria bacterium]|nr:GGDEF domain-containing protein [Gammaproteobacteria bacterium]
ELQGFSRSIAELEWLLLILTMLYYVSPGIEIADPWSVVIAMVMFAFFTLAFHYFNFFKKETRWKLAVETWAMLLFISWIIYFTGGVYSPLLNLYLLVIIASALTLGKITTLLEFALITCLYLYMGYPIFAEDTFSMNNFIQLMVVFAPFLLVGYLTTMLSADVQHGRSLLQLLSETDELTGMHNRRSLVSALENEVERALRTDKPFALMQVDADNLKSINDTHGHEAGDKLLKHISSILEESCRSYDVLARVGGDEFVVVLPGINTESANAIAERIRTAVENSSFDYKGSQVTSTVSIGLASFPETSNNIDELMDKADKAMYQSKSSGRNKVSIYTRPQVAPS